ncbi:OmpH family outer membrane protein [Flavobacterium rakeshii]|uniref:OmpH family outer membrane protein n=1 Tax=Flavobacterium rakeshii TaxID=1038845 RepID=UPI002E7BFB6B|nr:OmpH family outer membrane protein [Flavobacterium rakeshii]MEE1900132.1 OmpH family outer membrane protein [Flavobacterium rakeshii]
MKKHLLILLTLFSVSAATAQSRGLKIAYIDMDYILEKVPDYAEAKNQLELKAQKWKQELEQKKNDINKLKESLDTEKPLLTKELIEEREEEIKFLENDLIEYQLKRFGPNGDLITQKAVLVKPVQDQVFNIVQDLAESRNYDFIFDKSSDMTMLFSAKRHDISDFVIRRITRAAKREKLSGKELKQLEEMEKQEELEADPQYQERQQKLEDRKAERERIIEERRKAQEEKRRQYEERREQLKKEREAKRNGTKADKDTTDGADGENTSERPAAAEDAKSTSREDAIQAAKEERERKIEERKKQIEERKKQILEQREAAKKAREEQRNKNTKQQDGENDETTPQEENNQG